MVLNGPVQRRGSLWSRLWPLGGRGNRRTRSHPVARPSGTSAPAKVVSARRRWPGGLLRLLVLLGTLGTLVVGGWGLHRWMTRSRHFALRDIRVSPTRRVTADALRARAGLEPGQNLLTIDLDAIAREVRGEPWVRAVRVRRELPRTVAIDVVEREPACVVSLAGLYLAEASGEVFKRATLDEAAGLPVVTGVPRDGYVDDREAAQALIREALAALEQWRSVPVERPGLPPRPAVGEVHIDAALGATLYTAERGVGVRLGKGDAQTIAARLQRLDAVWQALVEAGDQPLFIHLDHQAHPERVTVKLASVAPPSGQPDKAAP